MKVIKLNDGTIINSYDDREALESIIYEYLGSDAFHLFDDYIEELGSYIDDLREEIRYLNGLLDDREDN